MQVWVFDSIEEGLCLSDLLCKKLEARGYSNLCSLSQFPAFQNNVQHIFLHVWAPMLLDKLQGDHLL